MNFDFDELIDRRGTHSTKWDRMTRMSAAPADGIPMWVADMDFRAPDVILDRARAMLDHGVLGYGFDEDAYRNAIAWWMRERHGWDIGDAGIWTTAGVVNAVGYCLDVFTDPGDGIVMFSPIYHAFARVITSAGRRLAYHELARDGDRYTPDFEAAEAALTGDEKMIIWCAPHNPVGRVWTAEEMDNLVDFAERNDLIIVSDEIHQDIVYPGHRHLPMGMIERVVPRLVVLNAISKTFNTAGMHVGNVIIPDATLAKRFSNRMDALGQSMALSTMGAAMVTAAYSPEGAAWVDALVAYLDENRKTFERRMNALPGIRAIPLEATYLSWLDFSGTGMSQVEMRKRVEQDAGIAPSPGPIFGPGSDSFLRFNIGTQASRLDDALTRLETALSDLQ